MGLIPPPFPLNEEQFKKRWNEGKRTMRELDPALYNWYESGRRQRQAVLISAIVSAIVLFLFIMGLIIYAAITR
ncbi:MAG: hypothetical protein KAS32_26440 [Candidatus Peribacteraceae bacterium]|nr:hypothetical protein [Candidatus Peribacteraceae bacterium]